MICSVFGLIGSDYFLAGLSDDLSLFSDFDVLFFLGTIFNGSDFTGITATLSFFVLLEVLYDDTLFPDFDRSVFDDDLFDIVYCGTIVGYGSDFTYFILIGFVSYLTFLIFSNYFSFDFDDYLTLIPTKFYFFEAGGLLLLDVDFFLVCLVGIKNTLYIQEMKI